MAAWNCSVRCEALDALECPYVLQHISFFFANSPDHYFPGVRGPDDLQIEHRLHQFACKQRRSNQECIARGRALRVMCVTANWSHLKVLRELQRRSKLTLRSSDQLLEWERKRAARNQENLISSNYTSQSAHDQLSPFLVASALRLTTEEASVKQHSAEIMNLFSIMSFWCV